MIPIEELKPVRNDGDIPAGFLLMIPIEELKHAFLPHLPAVQYPFDDTYWGIETLELAPAIFVFETFDDTYWGIETWVGVIFSGHCLSFDDTYWGIETCSSGDCNAVGIQLLMIPIEELKLVSTQHMRAFSEPFDDTYWGIETQTVYYRCNKTTAFDDTYWGIETNTSWQSGG